MSFINARARLNAGPLSDEQISRIAPSVFATDKHVSRSERYTYIPTSEVVAGMREQGFLPVFACQGRSRIEGKAEFTKHLLRFRHAGTTVTKAGDTFPEVILLNSHDGTSAYRIMSGLYRVACMNGLYCSEATFADVRVPHKGDVVDRVIEGSFQVLEDSKQGLLQAESWAGIQVGRDAQMAMAEAAHVLRFGQADDEGRITVDTPIRPEQLLETRRREDREQNLWVQHNVVQENVIRGGLSAMGRDANNRRRQVTSKAITGIDGDIKLNRALAVLSERMASILGG